MKWWRDYAAECAEWDARFLPTLDPKLVKALTEDGIEIRVRLWARAERQT